MDADYILTNKRFLPQGVFADKEYSEETENNRRILRPIYRAARNNKSYVGKCKMVDDTLVIQGIKIYCKGHQQTPRGPEKFQRYE